METSIDLAALHGHLSGDGCVIKNPSSQPKRYYRVDFRNTEPALLRDFQERFENIFLEIPTISKRQDRCTKSTKEIYDFFASRFGSFYSREWRMPEMTDDCAAAWLRAFFDCEGWVVNIPGKDRAIGLESVNLEGLRQVQSRLQESFGISSSIHPKRAGHIFKLNICGKQKLRRFCEQIGFLHPKKRRKLDEALNSYEAWRWAFPAEHEGRRTFVRDLIMRKGYFQKNRMRIYSREENLRILAEALKEFGIGTHISRRLNGKGTAYHELGVYGSENLAKLRQF